MGVGRSKGNQKEEEEEIWPEGLCKIVVVGSGAIGIILFLILSSDSLSWISHSNSKREDFFGHSRS